MTSTAARAASGMYSVNGRSHMTTTTRNRECTMAEMDECAPARTLVAVRAMAPVAAKPPKNTEATLPIPCEISSIFELCLSPVMLSATTQASSDSMPASRAMVSASGNSSRIRSKVIPYGKVKSGKPVGNVPNREPMVSVGRENSHTSSVDRNTATTGAGTLGILCLTIRMTSNVKTATPNVAGLKSMAFWA